MKVNKFLSGVFAFATFCSLSAGAFAKQVALFEQPSDKAKVVGTVDLAEGIIPIFTPKDGNWVKVADPRNGNVGWIKSTDLNASGATSFSFSQRILNDEKKPENSYRIFQFGNTSKKSDKELQDQLSKLEAQQQLLQESVNKSIRSMVNDMNKLYQQYWQIMNDSGMPIIMPVMIVPAKSDTKSENKK